MTVRKNRTLLSALCAAALTFGSLGLAQAQDAKPALSLITATPDEGFALAVKLSQRGVGTVQPDVEVRKKGRPEYSNKPEDLIAASQVIAINFQTVAAANDYWRGQGQ